MDQVLGDRVDRYQQSDEQQMNQRRTAWSLAASSQHPRPFGAPDHPAAGGLQRAPVEAVVALMDAVDGRLHSTAQILLPRVQGGV